MKFAVKAALTVLLLGLGLEAAQGVLFCLNQPSDGVVIVALVSVFPISAFLVRGFLFIWGY